jgi:hypothetical protein
MIQQGDFLFPVDELEFHSFLAALDYTLKYYTTKYKEVECAFPLLAIRQNAPFACKNPPLTSNASSNSPRTL